MTQCQYCGKECKNLSVHLRFCKEKQHMDGMKPEQTEEPNQLKPKGDNEQEMTKEEPKSEVKEPIAEQGTTSISVIVGDVSIQMNVPNSTLQDIAQTTVDLLQNIASLRSEQPEVDQYEPETKPEAQPAQDRDLDIEGNQEYKRLMSTLKEETRIITPPEPLKKKGLAGILSRK